jgi:hypothetical protein
MKFSAVLISAILASPVFAANAAPFDIDSEKMLDLFLVAVAEQLPDIQPEDLLLDHGIWVHCWSTRPSTGPDQWTLAINDEFRPCTAGINFKLSPGSHASRYRDREGNRKVHSGIEIVSVDLTAEGNIKVGSRVPIGLPDAELPCEPNAAPPPDVSPIDQDALRFFVDPTKILEVALKAVTREFPDIQKDELFLGSSMISLSCKPPRVENGVDGPQKKIAPCVAKLTFGIPSQTTESRYVDADGQCTVMPGIKNVRVMIVDDGGLSFSRSGFYGMEERVVECREEFHESLNKST